MKKYFWPLSSFQALVMFRRGLFYAFLSIYLRYFLGMSVTETTLFATIPMVLNVIFQTFVWGVISDRTQKRRTLIITGEILAAAGTVLVWWIHILPENHKNTGWILIIGLGFIEIFWSMSNVGWSALISDLYPAKTRTSVQGNLASLGGVGRIIGVWIGGFLYDGLTLKYPGWGFESGVLFFCASGAMVISAIPMFFLPEGGVNSNVEATAKKENIKEKSVFIFVLFLISLTFINFGQNSVSIIKSQYLSYEKGFAVSSQLLSYIVSMESVAIILIGIFVGRTASKIKKEHLLLAGTLAAATGHMIYAFSNTVSLLFLANFLNGSATVLILSSSYTFASELIPEKNRAKLFGAYNATFFLSWGLAGTFISGPLIDYLIKIGKTQVFSYKTAFLVNAFIVITGFILIWMLITYINSGKMRKTIE